MSSPRDRPDLRVVRGVPTDEELAALVTVVAARAAAARAAVDRPREVSPWSAPGVRLRRPLHPAPGGWRRSALPG